MEPCNTVGINEIVNITEMGKSHDLEVYLANYNINERQQWIDMIANLILLHLECLKETN